MAIIIMVTVIIGALVDVSVYSERFGEGGGHYKLLSHPFRRTSRDVSATNHL